MRALPIPFHPAEIHVSRHALRRYVERVRPGLDEARAVEDLSNVAEHAKIVVTPPPWYTPPASHVAERYLEVGDMILPLRENHVWPGRWHAMTCLVRPSAARRRRDPRSRSRRHRLSARRRAHLMEPRRRLLGRLAEERA
jgi:hypothetical protein